MKKFLMVIPLVFLLCFTFGCQQGEEVAEEPVVDVTADKEEDVKTAVIKLYSAINDKDTDTFVQYMAPGGYTEFPEDGSPLFNIDEEYIRSVFKGDWKTNFEIQELNVKAFESTAVVTGYRVNKWAMSDGTAQEERLCLSMMWFHQEGKWKLAHVHLSQPQEEK